MAALQRRGLSQPAIIVIALGSGAALLITAWLVFFFTRAARGAKELGVDGEMAEAGAVSGSAAMNARAPSIRSVVTLPAYKPTPEATEQVLGREGERDGVDSVVHLPSPADLEAMREDEMAALYHIRRARREQTDATEARRAARRDARARRDFITLEQLRRAGRDANRASGLPTLRREHERAKAKRASAVASVQYASVGLAHHDGSRVRASSGASVAETMGLLAEEAGFTPGTSMTSLATNSIPPTPNDEIAPPEYKAVRVNGETE